MEQHIPQLINWTSQVLLFHLGVLQNSTSVETQESMETGQISHSILPLLTEQHIRGGSEVRGESS